MFQIRFSATKETGAPNVKYLLAGPSNLTEPIAFTQRKHPKGLQSVEAVLKSSGYCPPE